MYRTLAELKKSVEDLIAQQGADASCASFIFTKNDVFYWDEEYNEQSMNSDDTDEVLSEVGSCDYIYERVGEIIDDEVRRVQRKKLEVQ